MKQVKTSKQKTIKATKPTARKPRAIKAHKATQKDIDLIAMEVFHDLLMEQQSYT